MIIHNSAQLENTPWPVYQLVLFRIAFVFLLIFCLPTNPGWYVHLIQLDWARLHCFDLYDLAHISPEFVKIEPAARWGIGGYLNWGWTFIIALISGSVWSLIDRQPRSYHKLYYWLLVLVRYRAALGIIGFSFEKIFPTQMPYPSYANLITDFGDYGGHKVFWTSVGIVPWFQVACGLFELVPGIMLLFRKTTALGAAFLVAVCLTIVFINLGHDGGVHVYSSYFVLLGLVILSSYAPAIYRLFILQIPSTLKLYYPSNPGKTYQWLRYTVKGLFGIYIIVFSWLQYLNFKYDPYKQASAAGVKALRGYYDVLTFRINNADVPYSPLDTLRWQKVTFEDWPTLTYKVNKPVQIAIKGGRNIKGHSSVDLEKNYEASGIAGRRRYFHYYADTIEKTLYLLDKNYDLSQKNTVDPYSADWISAEAWRNIGDDRLKIPKHVQSTRRDRDFELLKRDTVIRQKMKLHYDTTDGRRIILTGTNENKDSVYIVLAKIYPKRVLKDAKLKAGHY